MSDFELKKIHPKGVPSALERASQYRLLNEPWEAASICRDVLAVDPENQVALVTLILALSDQFNRHEVRNRSLEQAEQRLPQLKGKYERDYYEGIIRERSAKAAWRRGDLPHLVAQSIRDAMVCYERAESNAPADNDDALLRWNTCVRMLKHLERTAQPAPVYDADQFDADDGPPLH